VFNARVQNPSQDDRNVTRETRAGGAIEEMMKFSLDISATSLLMSTCGRTGLERIR